jgi:hypothetical protein
MFISATGLFLNPQAKAGAMTDPVQETAEKAGPLCVLFIGNSQCGACDLPRMVEELAAADKGGRRIIAGNGVLDGASLKKHWEAGEGPESARGRILSEKWDFVVLQEIFCVDEAEFQLYARLFHELIKGTGAQTLLFSTASIIRGYPDGFERLHRMHLAMSRELGVPFFDASHAYFRYLGENPSRERMESLFHRDLAHPGLWGSYLYACGLYSELTGRCPIGLPLIPAEALRALQEAAWTQHLETLSERRGGSHCCGQHQGVRDEN